MSCNHFANAYHCCMNKPVIHIENARQHNLKNIDIDIPRDEFVVLCGPSGSGKSTLAFDIVYAEGQRRYVESLSAYARQFLPQMDKPDVSKIEGLSPAISLEQQGLAKNPRSTVGTVTEIHDFLRVFFARLGQVHCTQCGKPIESQTLDEIISRIQALPEGSKFMLLSPLVERKKGTHQERFKKLKAAGFARVRVDGEFLTLDQIPELNKNQKHDIDLVVDRLIIKEGIRSRLADSVELALREGSGRLIVYLPDAPEDNREIVLSSISSCPDCGISMASPSPQLFSFNGPQGACPRCVGLGAIEYFEPRLIAPNKALSLSDGGLLPWANKESFKKYESALKAAGKRHDFTLKTPLKDYSREALDVLFYGEDKNGKAKKSSPALRRNWMGGIVHMNAQGDYNSKYYFNNLSEDTALKIDDKQWPGVIPILESGMQYGDVWREELARFRQTCDCPDCKGARLKPEALSVKINDINIAGFCSMSVEKALTWIQELVFTGRQQLIAEPLLKELIYKLSFMKNVGLEYLSLGRSMNTLSGGEAQRIRLASQLGSGLVGVTYVLDEPSIGLHPRDNERLLGTLRSLQQRGNTVLVVEHDEATICEADTVIELGPGSGAMGGEVMFHGNVDQLLTESNTLTARYLRGDESIPLPEGRREARGYIELKGIRTNNLDNLDCKIPMGVFTCITGVSGSGKSSLVIDTLYKHLAINLGLRVEQPGTISGLDYTEGAVPVEHLIAIDQSPIGRIPRSNPATYTKIFDEIRNIFANTPEARKKGYKPGRFSFNVKGGRCEACSGDGQIRVEMHFLPDVYVTCDVCQGKRYNHETLEVRYKGLNIAEVLDLTVEQAVKFFENYPVLTRRLKMLEEVGLGYLRLGQPATTLSGGEAQRIKISRELGKKSLPGTLYVLDEPTTGLHMHEVGKLVGVLHALVEKGASVVVIEHNTDMILAADYVIDMGPGGGEYGGKIISCGTPEAIVADPQSITGKFLMEERSQRARRHVKLLENKPILS